MVESDSSIQPLSAGRWRVTRERCGEIGMWRKQVRASASSHTNLEPLVIILFYFFYYFFIIIYYLFIERGRRTLVARVAPNLPIMWPALCPPPIPDVKVVTHAERLSTHGVPPDETHLPD